MKQTLRKFLTEEQGHDLFECALLLAFLVLAVIALLPALEKPISHVFDQVAHQTVGNPTSGKK